LPKVSNFLGALSPADCVYFADQFSEGGKLDLVSAADILRDMLTLHDHFGTDCAEVEFSYILLF